VIREWLLQIVAEIPAHREAVGHHPHELPLRAKIFEEHDELELVEDHRIHRRPAALGVERAHQLPHKREIERRLKAAVEMVLPDEVL
jgi:hypothetical protein